MAVSEQQKFSICTHIRARRSCSRGDLAARLSAAAPTVSNLVRELIDLGLVVEDGYLQSAGGRRPAVLKLRPDYAHAMGVEVTSRGVCAVMADLAGNLRAERAALSPQPRTKDEVLDALFRTVDELVRMAEGPAAVGMGIGISGLVSRDGRVSREFPHAVGWKDVPVAQLIEQRFGMTPLMDNDVHAAALGELRFAGWHDTQNAVYLQLGRGIAVGLITGGRVHRGASGNAGEFGHIAVREDGPICYCGNRGCLETLASPPALEAQCVEALQRGVRSVLSDAPDADGTRVTIRQIFEAARANDRLACNLLEEAGRAIGTGLANLVNVYNPGLVILGGELAEDDCPLVEIIERTLRGRVLPSLRDVTRVSPAGLKERACALGAAALVFDDLFSSPGRLFAGGSGASREGRSAQAVPRRSSAVSCTKATGGT